MVEVKKEKLTAWVADSIVQAYADDDELTWEECRDIGVEDSVCADVQSVLLGAGCVTSDEWSRLLVKGYPGAFVESLFDKDGWRASDARDLYLHELIDKTTFSPRTDPDRVRLLIRALKSRDPYLRRKAVKALKSMGPAAKDAVPALMRAVSDRDYQVKSYAFEALGEIGRRASEALPLLRRLLRHKDCLIREKAIPAFARVAGIHAVTELSKMIDEGASLFHAVNELKRMGPDAKGAVPTLLGLIERDSGRCEYRGVDIRREAILALDSIGIRTPDVVGALTRALDSDSGDVQMAAISTLGNMESAAESAVPALIEVMEGHPDIGIHAAAALVMIGTQADAAYPVILEGLRNSKMQGLAAEAICALYLRASRPKREKLLDVIDEALRENAGESPLLEHLSRVIRGDDFDLTRETLEAWNGWTARVYGGEDAITFFYRDGAMDSAVPGRLSEDGSDILTVSNFMGEEFELAIDEYPSQMKRGADALSRTYRRLPSGFFEGIKRFVGIGYPPGYGGGYYKFHDSAVAFNAAHDGGAIIHELGHHWDFSHWEASGLFDKISWAGIPRSRYVHGSRYRGYVPGDRRDFDRDDFLSDYTLCNPDEDLADTMSSYVCCGLGFRKLVRDRMAEGNFELAAKYLFVKHVMPFEGREYLLNGDSLTIEEVKRAYLEAEDTSKTNPGTYDVILEIEKSINRSS